MVRIYLQKVQSTCAKVYTKFCFIFRAVPPSGWMQIRY